MAFIIQFIYPAMAYGSILLLLRNYPSDSSLWICHVPGIPGDDMDMQVHYRLTCWNTVVYPDIIPVRRIFQVHEIFYIPDQLPESSRFVFCYIKDRGDVPF